MMGIEEAIAVTYEALLIIIQLTYPPLLVATAIGFAFTILQSVTNVNEMSLQQDFKVLGVLVTLFVMAPGLYIALRDYTLVVFDRINGLAPPPPPPF